MSNQNKELTDANLRQHLKEYRKSLNMTQSQFAEQYGFQSAVPISLYENHKRKIPDVMLPDLINYLIAQSNKELVSKIEKILEEEKEINLDHNGTPVCKNCSLMENFEQLLLDIRGKYDA